jgi:hypothetical protein
MTCAEFQHQLPDLLDEGGSVALQAHLKSCAACSEIATSLQTIIDEAKTLQSAHEPSPRVWNSIEIALRKEGLIRQPQPRTQRFVLPSLTRRWGAAAWLVPAAAALLVLAAVFLYKPSTTPREMVKDTIRPPAITVATTDPNDEQLLKEVAMRSPTMRETYESNLKDVNAYIQDAQDSVNADPNDEEAQQALMDAYGQKSMIYEMALDRSLP